MITDTNVHLSRWPFRRLPGDETAALVARLRRVHVTRAWAASFDAILHRDLAGANARLAVECRRYAEGLLIPFGAVNPALPAWQQDLERCAEIHKMPGVRLYPNYHGYELQDSAFLDLLRAASQRGMLVQIAMSMEDTRTQHRLVRVPPVNPQPLADALQSVPGAKVMLLNWAPAFAGLPVEPLAKRVWFDIATVEGVEGVARRLEAIPADRLVFGSHAPLFHLEAAILKMRESGLPRETQNAILSGNAGRILLR